MTAETNGRRLRVLLIAPSLEILGGQAVQATRLLASLRDEPSIEMEFQPIDPKLVGPFQFITRIKFVRTVIRSIVYSLQLIWRVPRFDVIHTFSAGKSSYVLWTLPALAIGKLWGKLLIVNYRDGQAEEHLSWKGTSTTLKMADAIVSPSDYVVKIFADHGIPSKRIFNIIEPAPFIYRQRSRLKPVFLTNRILEPLYNVECVLRAFALIQQRYPEASLTVAHDGPSRRGLERLARELGLRNTRFVGRVPHERTPQLYNAADIYLTSPNVDCMPGSLIECFCSGLPVIATNVGGIPFIVEHERTGLLVNRNDHEAMAACAIRLLEDPALVERLTSNARAEVERYNAAAICDQWVPLYHEIAAARRNDVRATWRAWADNLRGDRASALRSAPSEGAGVVEDPGALAHGRPLRVLLIAPSIEILGGQAIQAIQLLASLRQERSIDIEFQPIDPRLAGPFYWVRRIKFVRTVIRSIVYSLQLIWRVPRFDVIHTFSAGKSSYVLWTLPALVVAKLWRKRFIVNYHDGQAAEHLSWKGTSTTLQMADAIVSPSDYVVKVFAEHGIGSKRIFNIIEPAPFVFRQRSRLKPVFLTNRILEPLYNVECVLRAFALIQQRYPEASLTIAHDGPSRRGLERLARELGLRNAQFIGRVPYDRTPQMYNAAEIYLTSTNADCMPGSLIECFCSGVPVIATNVGGIPFIVEHERTGLLVNRNDHEAMAACAIRLLEDPALVERLTSNARAEVERYNAAAISRQWVSLYHEIAAEHGAEWRMSRQPASYRRIRGVRPD